MYKISVMCYIHFFIWNDCYRGIKTTILILGRFNSFASSRRSCDWRISVYADLGQMKLAQ